MAGVLDEIRFRVAEATAGVSGGPVSRLAAAVALLVLAAAGSRSREVTRLGTTGMLNAGRGAPSVASGVVLVAAACAVLAVLVTLLARRRRRRDDELVVIREVAGTRWQRAVALLAALALAALLVAAVLALVHIGPAGHQAAGHPPPVLPAAPHLPGTARPAGGGSVINVLLAVTGVMIAAAMAAVWLRRRRRVAAAGERPGAVPSPLAAAVAAGTSALGAAAGARAAIISCYAAMEESLSAAGSPRLAADTPEELLNRAVGTGAIRTPAAARLTVLFREARFSPHRLGDEERTDAQAALDDIARDLAAQ